MRETLLSEKRYSCLRIGLVDLDACVIRYVLSGHCIYKQAPTTQHRHVLSVANEPIGEFSEAASVRRFEDWMNSLEPSGEPLVGEKHQVLDPF